MLRAAGVSVEFTTRGGTVARALDGVDLLVRAGRGARPGRRVGLGQDHAGPDHDGTAAAHRGRGAASTGSPLELLAPGRCGPSAVACRWCSRTRRARSTRGTPSTSRWPRGCACTAWSPPTRRAAPRRSWSPRRCPRPGCARPRRLFLRYPHELSGGQRQRVLIAGALALRPELLIADEPVSSPGRLDPRRDPGAAAQAARRAWGSGVLVVTHDLGLAWNIADRIAVMYLGRVVEAGPTEEVLSRPQHPYTQALLSVVPEIERARPRWCSPARSPTRPGSPPAAGSTRAARRWPTARPVAVEDACRTVPLAILPADPARATTWPATWWPPRSRS